MENSTRLILASRSIRRQTLLRQLSIPFSIKPADVDENYPEESEPAAVVEKLAVVKAMAISARYPNALVLGADTLVAHRGRLLGKPSDPEDAFAMLKRLSGSTHTVYTGIALLHEASQRRVHAVESTEVTFGRLSDSEIAAYVDSGSPMDKAGAYGIQDDWGAVFVEGIRGDYYTVVGLPLRRLYELLKVHYGDLFSLR